MLYRSVQQSPVGEESARLEFLNTKRSIEIPHHSNRILSRRSNVEDECGAHRHGNARTKDSRRPSFEPKHDGRQEGRQHQDDRQFVNSRKNVRGQQSNRDRSECASKSNEQIKRRQVTRGRFSLNEFAVTKKTD